MICNLGVVGSNPTRGSKEVAGIMGKFQSGQMGQTVNLLSFDFGGSNPSPPTSRGMEAKPKSRLAEIAQLIEH